MLGIVDSVEACRLDNSLKDVLATKGPADVSARQAAAQMRGVISASDGPKVMPPICTQLPPFITNCVGDGSVSNHAQKQFALGGSGAWHPARSEHNDPASKFEQAFATVLFADDGC